MRRALALGLLTLVACGGGAGGPGRSTAVSFRDLINHPGVYAGREVRVRASYVSSFEVSVLSDGLAESFPPQPAEPSMWVGTGPPDGPCVQRAQTTVWAEHVVATGVFRYDTDGGFGHLGNWTMELDGARLRCA